MTYSHIDDYTNYTLGNILCIYRFQFAQIEMEKAFIFYTDFN